MWKSALSETAACTGLHREERWGKVRKGTHKTSWPANHYSQCKRLGFSQTQPHSTDSCTSTPEVRILAQSPPFCTWPFSRGLCGTGWEWDLRASALGLEGPKERGGPSGSSGKAERASILSQKNNLKDWRLSPISSSCRLCRPPSSPADWKAQRWRVRPRRSTISQLGDFEKVPKPSLCFSGAY